MTKFLSLRLKSLELIVQLMIFPIFAKNKNSSKWRLFAKKKATYYYSLHLTDEGTRAQAGYVGAHLGKLVWPNGEWESENLSLSSPSFNFMKLFRLLWVSFSDTTSFCLSPEPVENKIVKTNGKLITIKPRYAVTYDIVNIGHMNVFWLSPLPKTCFWIERV